MVGRRSVLFVHVPKTGGTSLKRYLYHRFPAQACLLDPSGAALEAEDLDRYALVAGHLDHDVVGRFRRRPIVVTCLRHPLERALSAYHYQRAPRLAVEIRSVAARVGEDAAAEILEDLRRANRHVSLADFLRHEPDLARKHLGDVQTRFLAGAAATSAHAGDPARLLAAAREHLEACEGILLVERLPESLALLDDVLGADALGAVPHDNPTPGRAAAADHDAEAIAGLAALGSLDAELYRVGEEILDRRLAARAERGARPTPVAERLPDAAEFTFDMPVRGRGWHVRERDDGGWFCWTADEAVLHLELRTSGVHVLRCEVAFAAGAEAWRGAELRVNDVPLAPTSRSATTPGQITASVPEALLRSSPGRVRIGIRVPRTVRPSDLDPANPDVRRLGIAVRRLRLTPSATAQPAESAGPDSGRSLFAEASRAGRPCHPGKAGG